MDLSKIQFQPKKGFLVKIDVFFSNHLNLSTKSRIPLNRGALNPGLSVYYYQGTKNLTEDCFKLIPNNMIQQSILLKIEYAFKRENIFHFIIINE